MVCSKCNGTGKKPSEFGLEVDCDCTYEDSKSNTFIVNTKITKGETEALLFNGMIPENRLDDWYSQRELEERIASQYLSNFDIAHLQDYLMLLNGIMYEIESTKRLTSSYIIGAPNSFGKTTFANTCIKIMNKLGMKTAPYANLVDIFEVYKKYDNRVRLVERMDVDSEYPNNSEYPIDRSFLPEYLTKHGMKVYLDCDILFTSLVGIQYKERELAILKLLTESRAKQGKATVVFIDMSLKAYTSLKNDKSYFWDEYLDATNGKYASVGKYFYTSCFKVNKQRK